MKIDLTRDVQPVTEFRKNAPGFLASLRERRNIVLTQHGKPAAVLLSIEEFQRIEEEMDLLRRMLSGMDDAVNGRTSDIGSVKKRLGSRIRRAG